MRIVLLLFLSSLFGFLHAQTKPNVPRPVACNCDSAIVIRIGKTAKYGVTVAPSGFGTKQEIQRTKANKLVFEQEHNTAWYIIVINEPGTLSLDIIPEKPSDDYDFILYRYRGKTTCDSVAAGTNVPLRSNLARSQNSNGGKTGLTEQRDQEHIGEGPGQAYSETLPVKKGESYLLVLDNVYARGGGHTLLFNYLKNISITGEVKDEQGRPKLADIKLYDDTGGVVSATKSDATTGKYELKTSVREGVDYTLVTEKDSAVPTIQTINTNALKTNPNAFQNLKVVLPELKTGMRFTFESINFYPGSDVVLPESTGSLKALYTIMKRNPSLEIEIEGHVNGVGSIQSERQFLELSEDRAEKVFDYLVSRGIDASRMTHKGFGAAQMLFPKAKTEEQMKKNRRVEIKVVSF